jgi:D-alanyl-D-alanine carboxypeptidase
MNKKAEDLKLKNTYFKDTTGLNNDNTSTAEEVLILAEKAFSNKDIKDIKDCVIRKILWAN